MSNLKKFPFELRTVLLVLAYLALVTSALVYPTSSRTAGNSGTETESLVPGATAEPSHTITWLTIAIGCLSVTTLISVGMSFYLYRWRKPSLVRDATSVPEALGRKLDGFGRALHSIEDAFNSETKKMQNISVDNTAKLDAMTEIFMTLKGAVDERDNEIRRLKRGYDQEVFRRFLARFIRVHQSLRDTLNSDTENSEHMEVLRRLLEDAFDECGLEVFQPKLGEDFRKADGVAENPRTEIATTAEQEFRIVEIIEQGYRLSGLEQDEVLVPAKVKILIPR